MQFYIKAFHILQNNLITDKRLLKENCLNKNKKHIRVHLHFLTYSITIKHTNTHIYTHKLEKKKAQQKENLSQRHTDIISY